MFHCVSSDRGRVVGGLPDVVTIMEEKVRICQIDINQHCAAGMMQHDLFFLHLYCRYVVYVITAAT